MVIGVEKETERRKDRRKEGERDGGRGDREIQKISKKKKSVTLDKSFKLPVTSSLPICKLRGLNQVISTIFSDVN